MMLEYIAPILTEVSCEIYSTFCIYVQYVYINAVKRHHACKNLQGQSQAVIYELSCIPCDKHFRVKSQIALLFQVTNQV